MTSQQKLVPIISTVLASVVVALVWYNVGLPTATEQGEAGKTTSVAPPLSHQFDATTLERLRAAMAAYEQVRSLLVQDSLEGLSAQARSIQSALEAAAQGAADLPPDVLNLVTGAAGAALRVADAAEASVARDAFGELSMHLVGLAAADPRLAEGLHIFKCTMAEGFQKWFQPSPELANPYMGQGMPTCGVPSEWQEETQHAHAASDEVAYYTCSMHPSVKESSDGKCPICAMDLTPVTHHELRTGTIFVDEVRRQRIGVRTTPVERRESILDIRAVGQVRYDETRLSDVNLRMAGWVQRLHVDETGQRVRRGQTLFTLYSPELYAAQLEFLTALRRRNGGSDAFASLTKASRRRLHLLGMTEAQIKELEQRNEAWEHLPILAPSSGFVLEKNIVAGARVEAGSLVYRIADLTRVWVDAEIYESDLPHVSLGQAAAVTLSYVDRVYRGKVDYIHPTLDPKTRTGRVRVVLNNRDLELKPDMYANVEIEVALGERVVIPDSAIVYTGPRRLVFVDLGEGRLQPKVVEVGVHTNGFSEITSGLAVGDVVVTSGNFLIAAESRIRSAAKYWEGSNE